MDFVIEENISNHGLTYRVREVVLNIFKGTLFLVLIPVILIGWAMGKFKKQDDAIIESDWKQFKEFNRFNLFRKYIDEKDLPDSLDFPKVVNDIHLCYYRSEPEIPELKNKYFDIINETESENGFYLISFNEKGKGMTLWYIDKENITMKKVKDLESQWWNLSKDKNKLIHLKATDKNHNYNFKIKESWQ